MVIRVVRSPREPYRKRRAMQAFGAPIGPPDPDERAEALSPLIDGRAAPRLSARR
jgi:hypothetical protein